MRGKSLLRASLAVFALLCAAMTAAAEPGPELWKELQVSRPQERGVLVTGLVLVRDAFTFRLESGAFFPLGEVSGRIIGGVFKGKGRFEINPATEGERTFLGRQIGQRLSLVFTDIFEEAVSLFKDGSAKELLMAPPRLRPT